MAARKKQSARWREQDPLRIAGGQAYEVGYESRKTETPRAAVKAVKKVGKVERRLGR